MASPSNTIDPNQRPTTAFSKQELALLVLILGVALLLRLYRLNSAPAGMNGDEFFNAVDALSVGPGNWPIFFPGNNGREAFFLYLMAIPLRIFGQVLWAVRLPAVLLGLGNILMAYLIGRQEFNKRVGLLAAALLAVSLWPMMQARLGYRAVSLTFLTAATIYLYGLAVRRRAILPWIVAGIFLGLTLYTYIPARVFPLVIIGWLIWQMVTNREQLQPHWRSILVSLLVALIIFAPFGLYMIQNPELVNQRINSVGGTRILDQALSGRPERLFSSITYVLFMFILRGDTSMRYHLAERPVFDPVTGLFFYGGLAITIWRAFKHSAQTERRASYGLLLLWAGAMLAPSALLGADTSFLRSSGAIVPIFLITAIGLNALYSWVIERWPTHSHLWRYGFVIIIGLGLFLTFIETWQAYFNVWVNNEEARSSYHTDLAEVSRFLRDHPLPDNSSLFIAYDYVAETTPQTFTYYGGGDADWFDHAHTFGWRPTEDESWIVVTTSRPLTHTALDKVASSSAVESVPFSNGDPAFQIYHLKPGDFKWDPTYQQDVSFVDGPKLIGLDFPEQVFQGETVPITLHFEIPLGLPNLANRLSYAQVFIEDASGNIWGQYEQLLGYPEAGWQAGDRFVQIMQLDVPQGMPPGSFYLRVGLSDFVGMPFGIVQEKPERAGPFLLRSKPSEVLQLQPDAIVFDGILALQDHAFSTLLVPGLPIDISLDWLVLEKPLLDFQVALEISDSGNENPINSQVDDMWPGTYPPSEWQMGDQITTQHRLDVPLDFPEDVDPSLVIHLISPDDEKPVPIDQGNNILAELTLLVREHSFEIPVIQYPAEAVFGESIRLIGYDLENASLEPGNEMKLTLYWQAIRTPTAGYTVFNHIVAGDGQIVGQFDSPPTGEAWLTSTWLPGEIITDERRIAVRPGTPAGDFRLIIGLYTASDGERLPVFVGSQNQPNDQLELTTVTVGD